MTKKFISKKVNNMDVSGVRAMFEMASKIQNPINLTLGLPDFDVPEEIKQEAINHITQGNNQYTPTTGIPELKNKIKEKLKTKNNIIATEDQIIITSSVSGALSITLTTILNPEDEVILFDPYFVGYKQTIIQNQAIPIFVNLNKNFSINFEELKNKITKKTKAILINTPGNPTGYICTKQELEQLAEIAKQHELLIISDEIYEDFTYEKKHFSIGSIYENTLTLNGFSKSCAMTGWRVGYLTGPQEIINACIKVQQFNFVCAPTPFQYAAIKALDIDLKPKVKEYKEKRDIIYNGLKNTYKLDKPEGAFYAFVKYPYNKEQFIKNCLKNNLLIVPGKVFSEKNTHFRISFANKNEILNKAIKILNQISKE